MTDWPRFDGVGVAEADGVSRGRSRGRRRSQPEDGKVAARVGGVDVGIAAPRPPLSPGRRT